MTAESLPAPAAPTQGPAPHPGRAGPAVGLLAAAIAAWTALCLVPALGALSENVENPSPAAARVPASLAEAFALRPGEPYRPVVATTFWLEARAGAGARTSHGVSVLIHAASAAVVLFLILGLLGDCTAEAKWCAASVAAAWGAHPLRVEPVAWLDARAFSLATLFALSSAAAYLKAGGSARRIAWLSAAAACYAVALGSSTLAAGLPLALWVIDGTRRPNRFALALAAATVALGAAGWLGADAGLARASLSFRAGQAALLPSFFLEKTLIPFGLAPFYTAPFAQGRFQLSLVDPFCLIRLILAAGAAAWLWRKRRDAPGAWCSAAAYVGLVLPLAFWKYEPVEVVAADRWSALATAAWAPLAVGAGTRAWSALSGPRRAAFAAAALVGLGALGLGTWRRASEWASLERVLSGCVAREPGAYLCRRRLGGVLAEAGRFPEALEQASTAARLIPPGDLWVQLDLCRSLAASARPDQRARARTHCAMARSINSRMADSFSEAHFLRGFSSSRNGAGDDAVTQSRVAVALAPDHARAHYNLGLFEFGRGELEAAVEHARRAVELGYREATFNLAYFLQSLGDLDAAAATYRRVLAFDPGAANAHFNLGVILTARGKTREAIEECRAAERLGGLTGPLCRRRP